MSRLYQEVLALSNPHIIVCGLKMIDTFGERYLDA